MYEYLASEIYGEYRTIFSFKKNIIELWKKDKSVLVNFMFVILNIVVLVILLIQEHFVGLWKYVAFIAMSILLIYLVSKFLKSANSLIFVAYAKHMKMIKKVENIFKKHGIDIKDKKQLESFLHENDNVNKSFKEKFNNIIDKISKLFNLFIIIPVGFLLTLGFNAEKDRMGLESPYFISNVITLIPTVIVIGIIIVITFSYIIVMFFNNDFISFIFPSQTKADVFNKYVRVFMYDSIFVNYKVEESENIIVK